MNTFKILIAAGAVVGLAVPASAINSVDWYAKCMNGHRPGATLTPQEFCDQYGWDHRSCKNASQSCTRYEAIKLRAAAERKYPRNTSPSVRQRAPSSGQILRGTD
ncbi:MAG: hypothetical protein ACR2O7_01365 [Parasphingorhabdus sp.]